MHITPRLEPEIPGILAARQHEFEQNQKLYAQDATSNIYLSPRFRRVWCLASQYRDLGPPGPDPVSTVIRDFNEYNPYNATTNHDQRKKLLAPNPGNRKFEVARQQFEALVPELQKALRLPVFVAPCQKIDAGAEVANFIGVRMVAQALAFEALLDLDQKHPELAVELSFSVLHLARALVRSREDAMLLDLMISVAIERIGDESLYVCLSESQALKAKTLERIIQELESQQLPSDSLTVACDYEMLSVHNSLSEGGARIASMTQDDSPTFGSKAFWLLCSVSGLAGREDRLYGNDWLAFTRALHSGSESDPHNWYGGSSPLWSDITGRHGLFAAMVLPNFAGADRQLKLARTLTTALRVTAGLRLFKLRRHHYPASLAELRALGVDSAKGNELSPQSFTYRLIGGAPSLQIPVSPSVAAKLSLEGIFHGFKAGNLQVLP